MTHAVASLQRPAVLRVALFWACFWLLLAVLRSAPVPVSPTIQNLLAGVLGAVGAGVLIGVFLRFETQTMTDIGLAWEAGTLRRFMLGTVLGVALVGFMLLAIIVLSGLRIESTPNPDYLNAIGFSFLVLFALAVMEELAFRSYALVRLSDALGVRASIYCTSAFFALYHGPDPANLLGPGVWGLLFGWAALASRGLALPLGLHFGLNWMQSLFGMKTQFATSVWTVVPGTREAIVSSQVAGLALQLVLLAVGILLIEWQVRKPDREEHPRRS